MVSYGSRGNPTGGRYGQDLSTQLDKAKGGLGDIARLARHSLAPLAGVLAGLNAIGSSLVSLALNAGYTTEAFRMANREFYRAKLDLAKLVVEAITPIIKIFTYLINLINRLPKGVSTTIITIFLLATGIGVLAGPMLLMIGYTITLILQLQRWTLWSRLASIGNTQLGASTVVAATGTSLLSRSLLFLQAAGGGIFLALGALALIIWTVARAFRSATDESDDFNSSTGKGRGKQPPLKSVAQSSQPIESDFNTGTTERDRPYERKKRTADDVTIEALKYVGSAVLGALTGSNTRSRSRSGSRSSIVPGFSNNRASDNGRSGRGPTVVAIPITINSGSGDARAIAKMVDEKISQGFRTGKYRQDTA